MIFSVDVNSPSLAVIPPSLARLSMSQSESLLPPPQMASVSPTTMVSHSASAAPQTEFLSSMTTHRVSYQDDQHHHEEDEEGDDGYEEDYDESTAVKYSFTLEDNMPVVIQAVGQEDNKDDDDDENKDCGCSIIGVEEEVEAEVKPVESKLVINIPAGNTVTLNSKEISPVIEEAEDDEEEEGAESTEHPTENVQNDQVCEDQEKTKKSKILDLLFGCFRFRCREKNKRQ